MAGGRLEAAYDTGSVRVWFSLYADFLATWDPLHYEFEAGVTVGAAVHLRACVLGACATVDMSFELSARLSLAGPSLHGNAVVDLEVTTVTVEFGEGSQPPPLLDWPAFRDKYLLEGVPAAVGVQPVTGLVTEPAGGPPPAGDPNDGAGGADRPWRIGAGFSFVSETRMPAERHDASVGDWLQAGAVQGSALDLAPMGRSGIDSLHSIGIVRRGGGSLTVGSRFSAHPIVTQVPEGPWRARSGLPPAAANTIPACTGVRVVGSAEPRGGGAQTVPGQLVDVGTRSLPLAEPDPHLIVLAEHARELMEISLTADAPRLFAGAGRLLASDAARLASERSAPPLLAPLAAGLAPGEQAKNRPVAHRSSCRGPLPSHSRSLVFEPSSSGPRDAAARSRPPGGPRSVEPPRQRRSGSSPRGALIARSLAWSAPRTRGGLRRR